MLRAVPDKLAGVIVITGGIACLLLFGVLGCSTRCGLVAMGLVFGITFLVLT